MTTTAKIGKKDKTGADSESELLKIYVNAAAVIFAAAGLMMLYAATSQERTLQQPEAMFGFSNAATLTLAGFLHLFLAGYLLLAQDLTNRSIVILWVGFNYLIFRVGTIWVMQIAAPFSILKLMGWRLGIDPGAVDLAWELFIVYLFVGSSTQLTFAWRRMRQLKKAVFEENWRQTRLQGSEAKPKEAKSPDKQALIIGLEEFKFSCTACGQHIQCNSSYHGRQIICPGCQHSITVPQAPTSVTKA